MIELDSVTFAYTPGEPVLDCVSVAFPPGMTLLIGPNGCGKSTLLRLAAGVERPDSGTIDVCGHDLWEAEVAARQELAYLPEHPDVTPYATIGEVLALVAGLRGEAPTVASEALVWAGLDGLHHRSVRELSQGQRRRAVLAAVTIGAPTCLLLDEPLEAMDRGMRARLLAWIGARSEEGATVVVVSHEIEPFAARAGRAVTVSEGRAITVDPLPAEAEARLQILESLARGEVP